MWVRFDFFSLFLNCHGKKNINRNKNDILGLPNVKVRISAEDI